MSFHDSWIAVRGMASDQLLETLGLEETGTVGMAIEVARPYAYEAMPGGWTIIYANFNGLADVENVRELSQGRTVVACDFQDKVDGNTAMIVAVHNGEKLWEIGAVDDEIFITGTPPPEFDPIRDRYAARLARDPQYVWMCEVPVDLGKELCGFRHDEDERPFKGLQPLPDSSWHRSLKLATHPKSQAPPAGLNRWKASKTVRSLLMVSSIFILVMILVSLVAN